MEHFTQREMDVLRLMVAGRSNREISAELVFTVGTVRWYTKQLYGKLGVNSRQEAIAVGKTLDLSYGERTEPEKHNLPAPTTAFIGREQELDDLARLMADADKRLITILGAGGMGKTRLALEVARRQLHQYRDGVFFVPLAPLEDADRLPLAIAEAIGYPIQQDDRTPKQQLLHFLSKKNRLLVLDNFEHLLEGADLLTEMQMASPGVTALVTSRERLSLHHEWVYAIGGMVVPESDTPEDVFDYDAAKLFLRCAQQVRPDFDGQGQPIVAHLCRLVGGMPLAILLAAAWVDTLPLEEIVSEIAGSLDVLTAERRDVPERHHSIRAVFEPTWRQLTAEEQNVFMRFSVFRGGCRREAAEQVAGATLPILQALVDKALLTCGADGRYEIHDLLRQYAAEKLEAKRGTADSRNAHSAHYLAFMKAREEDIKGRKQFEAAGEIEADFQNVRSAWLWAVEGKDYKGIDHSLETLYRFCELGTRLQEGEELFRLAQEGLAPPPGQEPHPVWGRIPVRRCWCTHSPEYERDKELVATSLAFARKQGDQREVAFCLTMLSSINLQTGREPAQTRAYLDESLKICQELDDRFQMAQTLRALGFWSSTMAGRLDDAYVYYQQAVDLHREMGNRVTEGTTLRDLGIITSIRGKQEEAEDYTREALTIAGELNALLDIAWGSGNLSSIIFDRGDFEQAAALAEEARSVALDINQPGIQACASCTLGWVAAMEGDYERSRELLEEGTALSQHPETVAYLNWGLSLAAGGLEAYAAARHHLHCALRFWGANRHTTPSLNALTVAGILLAHEGEVERAVEMLGLAFTHPASATGWMEKWPLLTRLRVDLEAELGAEVYQSAWERGAERDLDEVVAELLAAYKTDPAS